MDNRDQHTLVNLVDEANYTIPGLTADAFFPGHLLNCKILLYDDN